MALTDIIHQGEKQFTKEQFSLINFSFTGDLFLGEKNLTKNIHFEGSYGITGIIELSMYYDIDIEVNKDVKFINYIIIGYDDKYVYNIKKAFFPSRCSSPNKYSHKIYHGKTNSIITIEKKEMSQIGCVVCDCICGEFPILYDNFIIGDRDINIRPNENFWNNREYIGVFKSLLGASIQYKILVAEHDIEMELSFYNDFEYIISFMMGYDFGISICKFINLHANSIEAYVIRERKSNCNASYFILGDDIAKMRDFVEKSQIQKKISQAYYKETINALIKIHNEPDMLIKWSILIIAFERFLTSLLIENGFKKEDLEGDGKNLVYKLNKYNGIIRKIPKIYTEDKIIRDYRNPLIHSGEIFEADIDKLFSFYSMYLDLLYALIFESVGYTGDYILSSCDFKFGRLF
jgi:hypothetical protein